VDRLLSHYVCNIALYVTISTITIFHFPVEKDLQELPVWHVWSVTEDLIKYFLFFATYIYQETTLIATSVTNMWHIFDSMVKLLTMTAVFLN